LARARRPDAREGPSIALEKCLLNKGDHPMHRFAFIERVGTIPSSRAIDGSLRLSAPIEPDERNTQQALEFESGGGGGQISGVMRVGTGGPGSYAKSSSFLKGKAHLMESHSTDVLFGYFRSGTKLT
jgi:hypothetical protein